MSKDAREQLEIELLLEAIYRQHGLDFRNYALPSLRRRLWNAVQSEGVNTLSALQEKVLHDEDCVNRLIPQVSVSVTTMFRDPSFFVSFRQNVVPLLRSFPFVRIWHAGCATGEEVYSMAILLQEEGLLERSRLYATDLDAGALEQSKSGIFSLEQMQEYSANYIKAGGKETLSSYYTAKYDHAIFRAALRKNMVFSQHNLASDGPFNEFNVILCRNVMIYFDEVLQERALSLFHQSLRRRGFLALGQRESLAHTQFTSLYEELDGREKLYRKLPAGTGASD
jgi:chemotaxis protein methyltransferase CheR